MRFWAPCARRHRWFPMRSRSRVFRLISMMVSNGLNLVEIVNVQNQGRFADWGLNFLSWNWFPLLPMFVVYLISGVAETDPRPFDVSEGESEIVAGFHVEYSGMAFAVFFLAGIRQHDSGRCFDCTHVPWWVAFAGWFSAGRYLPAVCQDGGHPLPVSVHLAEPSRAIAMIS